MKTRIQRTTYQAQLRSEVRLPPSLEAKPNSSLYYLGPQAKRKRGQQEHGISECTSLKHTTPRSISA